MTSGADLAIAIGTIATAVVAVAGLFVSLRINNADRKRADRQAADDRTAAAEAAAEDRLAAAELAAEDRRAAALSAADEREAAARRAADDRAAIREDAARRHIVNLLLALGHQIAVYDSNQGGAATTAAGEVRLLLHALPPECAYATRKSFNVVRTMSAPRVVVEKQQWLGYGSKHVSQLDAEDMRSEIAFDVDRYLTSGLPPEKVWDDVDDLRAWARRRWPRE